MWLVQMHIFQKIIYKSGEAATEVAVSLCLFSKLIRKIKNGTKLRENNFKNGASGVIYN